MKHKWLFVLGSFVYILTIYSSASSSQAAATVEMQQPLQQTRRPALSIDAISLHYEGTLPLHPPKEAPMAAAYSSSVPNHKPTPLSLFKKEAQDIEREAIRAFNAVSSTDMATATFTDYYERLTKMCTRYLKRTMQHTDILTEKGIIVRSLQACHAKAMGMVRKKMYLQHMQRPLPRQG